MLDGGGGRSLSETAPFPVLPSQRQGIEDVHLVRFADEKAPTRHLGTCTACEGRDAECELLIPSDVADSFAPFCTVSVDGLLSLME